MQYLIAIEIPDVALHEAYGPDLATPYFDDDLVASLHARLDEVYAGPDNHPVKATVLAVGDFTGVVPLALDAMEVGIEGYEGGEHDVSHVYGSLLTMRQMLDVPS